MTTGEGDRGRRPEENTRPRQVRIADGLYEAARAKAQAEDRTFADVVRDLLIDWTGYEGPAVHGRDYGKRGQP